MPAGIIYAVYAAVFAVMQLAMMLAHLIGQSIGLLIALTIQHPRAMAVVYVAAAATGVGIAYGPWLYHSVRGEAYAISAGIGAGQGSNSELCRKARSTDPLLAVFNPTLKSTFQEALDQQCWRLPVDQVASVCPADLFDAASRPECVAKAEQCYRNSMELAAGLTQSATSTRDCLSYISTVKRMDVRGKQEAEREARPDGNWVRLTSAEDAAVIARVTTALGGVSPMVRQEERMTARNPQYLRFQWAQVYGEKLLAAAMSISHRRAHYVITDRLAGLDRKDPRDSAAFFVLGADSRPKIAIEIGYAGFKYSSYVARITYQGRDRVEPLMPIQGTDHMYIVDDAPFDRLVVFGGAVNESNQLYELTSSPRLADRFAFFMAVADVVGR